MGQGHATDVCDEKEGSRLSERDWTSEEVAARNKAGAALLTYARPKTLLCDAALSQSVTRRSRSRANW